ncbi:sodium:calcium antiporter [Myxosarcina sp. GI1]|uniref:sodium:calcium antiporter n=1 Tax=Myxosarcina sp. GI1 TaxID=1541065 RepID=UPI00055ADCC7|nr:sodium:calcium antiporter [Myxosarcina sp. GI1]
MIESLPISIGLFIVAAFVIAVVGVRMSRVCDRLADRTGWGEAVMGAVFLGGSTSLSGIVTSVTAAADGHAELAISNAVGGIAAQTAFLAIADIFYAKANLEHAAASIANLVQGTLLMTLLAIPMLAMSSPQVDLWGIHPATIILITAYVMGLRLVSRSQETRMWSPRQTKETNIDEPDETAKNSSLTKLWLKFVCYAIIVAVAGFIIARAGVSLASLTGISESVVGGLFTAITTSLPELVTTIAAVRQGALSLGVGGVIGGNCFDLMLLAFSDVAYRQGSIYGAIANRQVFVMSLTILMTGVLLLGLLRREKHGIGNIGFESLLILLLYASGVVMLLLPAGSSS